MFFASLKTFMLVTVALGIDSSTMPDHINQEANEVVVSSKKPFSVTGYLGNFLNANKGAIATGLSLAVAAGFAVAYAGYSSTVQLPSHPNIFDPSNGAGLYDNPELNGRPETSVYAQFPRHDTGDLLRMTKDVADAVAKLHENGIVIGTKLDEAVRPNDPYFMNKILLADRSKMRYSTSPELRAADVNGLVEMVKKMVDEGEGIWFDNVDGETPTEVENVPRWIDRLVERARKAKDSKLKPDYDYSYEPQKPTE